MLDRMAQAIEDYFGQAQGASLNSHAKLQRNFAKYAAQKNLAPVPSSLLEKLDLLQGAVGGFRDKLITHLDQPRRRFGTGMNSETKDLWLQEILVYPRDSEEQRLGAESIPIPKLRELLEAYIGEGIDYVTANRGRLHRAMGSEGATA